MCLAHSGESVPLWVCESSVCSFHHHIREALPPVPSSALAHLVFRPGVAVGPRRSWGALVSEGRGRLTLFTFSLVTR